MSWPSRRPEKASSHPKNAIDPVPSDRGPGRRFKGSGSKSPKSQFEAGWPFEFGFGRSTLLLGTASSGSRGVRSPVGKGYSEIEWTSAGRGRFLNRVRFGLEPPRIVGLSRNTFPTAPLAAGSPRGGFSPCLTRWPVSRHRVPGWAGRSVRRSPGGRS